MTAEQLLDAAARAYTEWPTATINHNPVAGLSIDVDSKFVGWIDTTDGTIRLPKEK